MFRGRCVDVLAFFVVTSWFRMLLQSRKFRLSLLLIVTLSGKLFSQASKDTTIILISDLTAQAEATDALSDMYDFKFAKAEQEMRELRKKYGWHPLPYFLLGLNEWWKIMPDTKNTSHDKAFFNYMDSSILIADNLYEKYPAYKIEAAFFLAAAYGFKGRLYADEERGNWRKAASVGKDALKYLEICKQKNNLSPELLFGDALYNYFSVWIPENYPYLKPLLWFFRKGDKQLGLKQLKEVSYNAFYTRTEAMLWLMRISNSYENDQSRAFQLAEYLHQTYPDNPYFHRYYARMLYSKGMYPDLEREAKKIIERIDSGRVGYEATSGRYASFYLGQMFGARRNFPEAKKYYQLSIKYAEANDATESGYYLYSLIELGEIEEKQGHKEEAKKYFRIVKKKAGRKEEAYKDAKKRLKNLEKGD
jgi:hypothetical protein